MSISKAPELKYGDARDLNMLGVWYNDLVRLQFEFQEKAEDAKRIGDYALQIEYAWKSEYSRLHGLRIDTLRTLIICKPYGGRCSACNKATEKIEDWYGFTVCTNCLPSLQCTFEIITEELER